MNPEEIVERIRKAVRLARKAATDGERNAAMNAAIRMAKSAGLDLDEICADGVEDGGKVATICGRRVNIDAIETQLAAWIMSRHFSIAVAFEKMRKGVKVLWIGNRLNIGIAQYAWEIMLRESEKAYERMQKERKVKQEQRSLYMRGFFFAIDLLLQHFPLRNDTEQAEAERKAAERELQRKKDEQKFNTKGTNNDSGEDGDAVTKGFRDGQKVRMNRPMSDYANRVEGALTGRKKHLLQNNALHASGIMV